MSSQNKKSPGVVASAAALAFRGRRRIATFCVVGLALFFGYHAFFGNNGINMYEQKRTQQVDIGRHIADLQRQNARLERQIHALKSDPDAIEHEARERLHYARPGEVIWTEPGSPEGSSASQANAPGATSR